MEDLPPEQRFAFEVFERESREGIIEIAELADVLRMTNLVITETRVRKITHCPRFLYTFSRTFFKKKFFFEKKKYRKRVKKLRRISVKYVFPRRLGCLKAHNVL